MIRKILASLARPVGNVLHATGLMRPEIIVRVDGGICSQMHFYLVGQRLRRLTGARVSYDLIWYDEDGKDGNGVFARNFDLLRLCPGLHFQKASSRLKLSLYRFLYKHTSRYEEGPRGWQSLRAPVYLDGYYAEDEALYAEMAQIFDLRREDTDVSTCLMAQRIASEPEAVGMHVRRGDLSVYVPTYGMPATNEYFSGAVALLQARHGKDIPVFIFSDEPQWVATHLMPSLPVGNYEIVAQNGSDRGYLDLTLLSGCRHFITSKGSLGKFAALLSRRRGDVVICSDAESAHWRTHFMAGGNDSRTGIAVGESGAGILISENK